MSSDAVLVAVRVRPFNTRERDLKSKLVVSMKGSTTTVIDPETSQPREFTFDYSYWSHDPKDAHFVDNHKVFADLGSIVLSNAWDGYNVCLFAYGQTGAGKSYSMVGYGNDKGIVPLSLEEMFRRMTSNGNPNVKYQVESSMMEIYNEKVRDLFNPDETPPEGLRVRDHPKLGPYVENLSAVVCTSYRDVEKLMAAGTAARTVASTNMNETSSRAHTIFQITFTTTTFDTLTKKSSNKVSKINLVDLAGSERLSKTGATGAIMKEGININKSLTSLGDCIEKLAKRNKDKNLHIPYRNSTLTWLLKQSLGGNSRTIMIAAVSPASDNYEETLSTLRYADRAKQIQNKAVVNEDENAKVIRELKKEIEALRAQLARGGIRGAGGQALTDEEVLQRQKEQQELEQMRLRMKENEDIIARLNMSLEDKMKESAVRLHDGNDAERRRRTPHLVNLHTDMLMAETLAYFFPAAETVRLVRKDVQPPPGQNDVVLKGLLIQPLHATITNTAKKDGEDGDVSISPGPQARVFVNGVLIKVATSLQHNDRVILGSHHVFRFVHPSRAPPADEKTAGEPSPYNWEFAQKELAEHALSSLAPEEDPELKRVREEEQKKMKEMVDKVEAEKLEALRVQEQQKKQFDEMMARLNEQKQKEFEEASRRLAEEQNEAAQRELQRKIREREETLERERAEAARQWEEKQREMKQQQDELEERLRKQQEMTSKLQRQREIENRDKVLLEQTLAQTIPLVNEANAMSDELKQHARFSIKLQAKKSSDEQAFTVKTEVFVRCMDVKTQDEVLYDVDTFNERLFVMRELYGDFLNTNKLPVLEDDASNPFAVLVKGPQMIGASRIYLQPNFYLFPITEQTPVIDYRGQAVGHLFISLRPIPQTEEARHALEMEDKGAAAGGGSGGETDFVFDEENVEELKGEVLELRLDIDKVMGVPQRLSKGVFCKYRFFVDDVDAKTSPAKEASINPSVKYKRTIMVDPVSAEFVEYLRSGVLEVEVWGESPTEEDKVAKQQQRKEDAVEQMRRLNSLLAKVDSPGSAQAGTLLERVEQLAKATKSAQQLSAARATGAGSSSQPATPRSEATSEATNTARTSVAQSGVTRTTATAAGAGAAAAEALAAEVARRDQEIARLKEALSARGGGAELSEVERLRKQNELLVKENERLKLASEKNSKACAIL